MWYKVPRKGGTLALKDLRSLLAAIPNFQAALQDGMMDIVRQSNVNRTDRLIILAHLGDALVGTDQLKISKAIDVIDSLSEFDKNWLEKLLEQESEEESDEESDIVYAGEVTADQVRGYLADYPEATSKQVAEFFGNKITVRRVGQIRAGLSRRKPAAKQAAKKSTRKKASKKTAARKKGRGKGRIKKNDPQYKELITEIRSLVEAGNTDLEFIKTQLQGKGYKNVDGRVISGVLSGTRRGKG